MKVDSEDLDASVLQSGARVYVFLENNQVLLASGRGGQWNTGAFGLSIEDALTRFPLDVRAIEIGESRGAQLAFAVLGQYEVPEALGEEWKPFPIAAIAAPGFPSGRALAADLKAIRANALRIPYLYFKETDYIYRFRSDKQRNKAIYHVDDRSTALYRSALCDAIKEVKRAKERTAATPATLDFGAVEYLLPSHFGFCLGVQNAIERAYETIDANPDKRVFMLSELIHNPFVNEDLKARGLRYLQSDKGVAIEDPDTGERYWDSLSSRDVVIIPAFGARDEDKARLIEGGLPLNAYDATCMLVEKVWKAAKRYGQRGYTIVIHGKAEHEETKATFSNSAKFGPSVIVRDMKEAAALADAIRSDTPEERARLFEPFRNRCSPGFDVERHLEKLALVNQTTLLRNETLKIIAFLEKALEARYGAAHIEQHMAMSSKGDTLCYATQVNQDALGQAIRENVDIAIVVGGKNSSNTFQLFRICEEAFGERAFYIQSEGNILSRDEIEHFVFPYNPSDPKQGRMERRNFLLEVNRPLRILITGGASCPDGLLQQIIVKINGYFSANRIRSIEDVVLDIEAASS
ncbi:MAG: 4-hydroxy-3-methylbut-2-enyl diphosphate reductase [Opitutales bacterium TMED158]|nr:MAG: 4-hydroxy-3-methylbut-2-enyl diphosphate reductase [Opitutales bacterium TMED158]